MNNEELNAIRERAERATGGVWRYVKTADYPRYSVYSNINGKTITSEVCRELDAQFIAHAREDIPKLLAEIERLNVGITRLRDRLVCDLDAVTSGDTDARSSAYEDCLTSTIQRIDHYIYSGGSTDD